MEGLRPGGPGGTTTDRVGEEERLSVRLAERVLPPPHSRLFRRGRSAVCKPSPNRKRTSSCRRKKKDRWSNGRGDFSSTRKTKELAPSSFSFLLFSSFARLLSIEKKRIKHSVFEGHQRVRPTKCRICVGSLRGREKLKTSYFRRASLWVSIATARACFIRTKLHKHKGTRQTLGLFFIFFFARNFLRSARFRAPSQGPAVGIVFHSQLYFRPTHPLPCSRHNNCPRGGSAAHHLAPNAGPPPAGSEARFQNSCRRHRSLPRAQSFVTLPILEAEQKYPKEKERGEGGTRTTAPIFLPTIGGESTAKPPLPTFVSPTWRVRL